MKISLKTWMRYKDRLARINKSAVDDMVGYVQSIGGYMGHEQEVIDYAYALATKYGEAAGELACQMYDATARASKTARYIRPAEPARTSSRRRVETAVRKIAEHTQDPNTIGAVTGSQVKRVALKTIKQNAARDGAEFAWIPSGDACAFCTTLASNGWQRISADAVYDHEEHIHPNCNCTYAVRFDSDTEVEGYDPDELYERYRNADGDSWRDKVNSMRREDYAENADAINEQKREAYARRKETS